MESISDKNGVIGAVDSLIGGRRENQDSYAVSQTSIGTLIVVCDGMGGGPGGKTASSIATQSIVEYLSGMMPEDDPSSVLKGAAEFANGSLLAAVEANPSLRGMGTTCVCLLLKGDKAFIMHVGDSRCYQLRNGKSIFRTSDHSYVGELVRRGTLTEEEARMSSRSNIITRALGTAPEIEADIDVVQVKPDDRFALMTDGVWGAMPEPQLVGLLEYDKDPIELVPLLTARIDSLGVSGGGGHDNLTLAIVEIPGKGEAPADEPFFFDEKSSECNVKQRSHTLEYILGGALALSLGVIAWLLYNGYANPGHVNDGFWENDVWYGYSMPIKKKAAHNNSEYQNREGVKIRRIKSVPTKSVKNIGITLDSVISTLNNVKNYKPDIDRKHSKESKKRVEKHRENMIEEALSKLEKIATPLELRDSSKANKIKRIVGRMRKDKQTMVRVDSKWLHSRADANQAIDRNIAEIRAVGTE